MHLVGAYMAFIYMSSNFLLVHLVCYRANHVHCVHNCSFIQQQLDNSCTAIGGSKMKWGRLVLQCERDRHT